MSKTTRQLIENQRQAAVDRIRRGEGPVTMHLVALAFARSYRTVKRWVAEGVLKVAAVRHGTKFVNRAQVLDLLDACEPANGEGLDPVDQDQLKRAVGRKR